MFEKKENNKKSLWNANTESNWNFFLCKWDSKCFRFFVEMLFCLFVCFIAFSIVSVGKRKVAVMTFYFLFCLECYFRNKLKHPSVGAGINFKSKYFAISRNSSVNLIQSFFSTVHKEFKFQRTLRFDPISFYYSMALELDGHLQWTLISVLYKIWVSMVIQGICWR